ncbi:MAG: hypothetical protein M3295_04545, partial [Chloroflexota bacterium]|nr:hypothetical protein [Chloroflexota bacterium]
DSGDPIADLETPAGAPIAAAISPNGEWLAYVTVKGESGMNDIWAHRLTGDPNQRVTLHLGESVADSPFLDRLAWSPGGRFLAYTIADATSGARNAWVFDTLGTANPVTDSGDAYAAAFDPAFSDAGGPRLWVSVAADRPLSYRVPLDAGSDPASAADATADGAFLPLPNADGSRTLFWRGSMDESDDGRWEFTEGGMPYLTGPLDEYDPAAGGTRVFSTLEADRDAFASAEFAWSADGMTFAVWNTAWTGEDRDGFPDPLRVYMTRADDPDLITEFHALDAADIPDDAAAIPDVALAPDGRHLSVTVQLPIGGELDAPRARLLNVTRNLGTVADVVEEIGADDGWNGPAVYAPVAEP